MQKAAKNIREKVNGKISHGNSYFFFFYFEYLNRLSVFWGFFLPKMESCQLI